MRLLIGLLLCVLNMMPAWSRPLLIGTSPFNPPFAIWVGNDKVYGFDVDLMRQICIRLDVQCKFQPSHFDNLFFALNSQKLDLVISSIIITENRRKAFLFSLPYLESDAQYITSANSPIESLDDVVGKRIGVRMGTPYEELVKMGNTSSNTIVQYHRISDVFSALEDKEIDLCLIDYDSAEYWTATNPGIYKLIGNKVPVGEGYGIMSNLSDTDLINRINQALLSMQKDGTYLKIYSQYFY